MPTGTSAYPDPGDPNLIGLIPAYNEGERVAPVVAGVLAHFPVLVVDDGSSDDTAERAEAAGATVIRQIPNQGKGAALQAGFRRALDEGYDGVLTLDADGQHDPEDIPAFLEAYETKRSDLIIGARDFGRMPIVRRLANRVGHWAFSGAMGRPIADNQSGYRLVGRRLMELMLWSRVRGFEFEVEMIVTCVRRNLQLDWVPIRTIYAGETSHIDPIRHVVNFTKMVWRARRAVRGEGEEDADA